MPRIEGLGDLEITHIPYPGNPETGFRITLDWPLSCPTDRWALFEVESDGSCVIDRDEPLLPRDRTVVCYNQEWLDHLHDCDTFMKAVPYEVKKCAQVLACYDVCSSVVVKMGNEPEIVFISYCTRELIRKPAKFTVGLAERLGRVVKEARSSEPATVRNS